MRMRATAAGLALLACSVALFNVAAGEPVVMNSASRGLKQFEGMTLPPGFKIPKSSCKLTGPYPFMVSIRDRKGDHLCGGVLIKSDVVLTAAHCIDVRVSTKSNPRPKVHIGGWDRDNPIEVRSTIRPMVPKSWTGDVVDGNDIAILKLNKPSCLKPIPFLGAKLNTKQKLEFLGFGRSSIGGSFSFLLQAGVFKYIPRRKCNRAFKLKKKLHRRSVCIKGPSSAGVCAGDDGGPIIIRPTLKEFKDKLVGIASYSTGACTDTDEVAIFTQVQPFVPWIRRSLRKLKSKS